MHYVNHLFGRSTATNPNAHVEQAASVSSASSQAVAATAPRTLPWSWGNTAKLVFHHGVGCRVVVQETLAQAARFGVDIALYSKMHAVATGDEEARKRADQVLFAATVINAAIMAGGGYWLGRGIARQYNRGPVAQQAAGLLTAAAGAGAGLLPFYANGRVSGDATHAIATAIQNNNVTQAIQAQQQSLNGTAIFMSAHASQPVAPLIRDGLSEVFSQYGLVPLDMDKQLRYGAASAAGVLNALFNAAAAAAVDHGIAPHFAQTAMRDKAIRAVMTVILAGLDYGVSRILAQSLLSGGKIVERQAKKRTLGEASKLVAGNMAARLLFRQTLAVLPAALERHGVLTDRTGLLILTATLNALGVFRDVTAKDAEDGWAKTDAEISGIVPDDSDELDDDLESQVNSPTDGDGTGGAIHLPLYRANSAPERMVPDENVPFVPPSWAPPPRAHVAPVADVEDPPVDHAAVLGGNGMTAIQIDQDDESSDEEMLPHPTVLGGNATTTVQIEQDAEDSDEEGPVHPAASGGNSPTVSQLGEFEPMPLNVLTPSTPVEETALPLEPKAVVQPQPKPVAASEASSSAQETVTLAQVIVPESTVVKVPASPKPSVKEAAIDHGMPASALVQPQEHPVMDEEEKATTSAATVPEDKKAVEVKLSAPSMEDLAARSAAIEEPVIARDETAAKAKQPEPATVKEAFVQPMQPEALAASASGVTNAPEPKLKEAVAEMEAPVIEEKTVQPSKVSVKEESVQPMQPEALAASASGVTNAPESKLKAAVAELEEPLIEEKPAQPSRATVQEQVVTAVNEPKPADGELVAEKATVSQEAATSAVDTANAPSEEASGADLDGRK